MGRNWSLTIFIIYVFFRNYHFFEKLVRDLNSNIGVGRHCSGGVPKGSSAEGHNRSRPSSSPNSEHHHRHQDRIRNSQSERCTPKIPADSPTVGCALFGLTNLKSFSETLNYTDINYCSLAGAWSLVDTPEFAVQITNKGGLSPLPRDITATTLVSFAKINKMFFLIINSVSKLCKRGCT